MTRVWPDPEVVDLVHEVFVRASPAAVRAELDRPGVLAAAWSGWPEVSVQVSEDRDDRGVRWRVDGEARGRAEVWLEDSCGGTIVHHYVHVAPTAVSPGDRPQRVGRAMRRRVERHTATWAGEMHRIKDGLEGRGR